MKKLLVFACVVSCILAMSMCFATSTGQAGFVSSLEGGLTQDALWGALMPFSNIIIAVTIFGFAYFVLRKVLKGFRNGKPKI